MVDDQKSKMNVLTVYPVAGLAERCEVRSSLLHAKQCNTLLAYNQSL